MDSPLFDCIDRSDTGPAPNAEPIFSYLNRSAREPMRLVRHTLENWYAAFPSNGRRDLRARFRSADDNVLLGAFFELYCHALLVAHEYEVEVHPESSSDSADTRPDFLVLKSGNPLFYFEATSAHESRKDSASRARRAQLQDAIDRINLPAFFVGMAIREEGPHPLAAGPVRSFLIAKAAEVETFTRRVIRHEYLRDGWRIDFSFFPTVEPTYQPTRPIGLVSTGAKFTECETSIWSSLKRKGGKYGDLPLPFVIGVNCTDPYVDQEDIFEALFGRQVSGDTDTPTKSDGTGFWFGPTGHQYSRVSAVLVATGLVPWTIGSSSPKLWLNPYPKRPFQTGWWRLPQRSLHEESGGIVSIERPLANSLLNTQRISDAILESR